MSFFRADPFIEWIWGAEKQQEVIKVSPLLKRYKKDRRKVQGVPQSQAAADPRHQEEEDTDKTKQAQIEQTHEKH